jgi:hypothetical protein
MTTMLENVARAAIVHMTDETGGPLQESDWTSALPVVRAVLLAIREPDEPMIQVGQAKVGAYDLDRAWGSGELRRHQASKSFTGMIDAILNAEGPTPPK